MPFFPGRHFLINFFSLFITIWIQGRKKKLPEQGNLFCQ